MFVYQILDGSDGIHARNLQQSSAIGEYFDHGFDTTLTQLFTICILSQVAESHPTQFLGLVCLFAASIGAHLVWFRARYTKIFHANYIGPQESISTLVFLHAGVYLFGECNFIANNWIAMVIIRSIQVFLCSSWIFDAYKDFNYVFQFYGNKKKMSSQMYLFTVIYLIS